MMQEIRDEKYEHVFMTVFNVNASWGQCDSRNDS